jgi:hypothetical protein
MFQLVFKGECTSGTDPETARNNAKTLFKANADQIVKMFSGQPVVIRNRLEEVQAEKYRGVLHKHGMVAYVEPMEGTVAPKPEAEPSASPKASAPPKASVSQKLSAQDKPPAPKAPPTPERPSAGPVKVEPGHRPNVAGEKVDSILTGSGLTLDPVGVTFEEHKEAQAPMFEHLDEWTLAPAGAELVKPRETPPPMVPDVSHLSLADRDDDAGRQE